MIKLKKRFCKKQPTFEIPEDKYLTTQLKFNEFEISHMDYFFRGSLLRCGGVVEARKYFDGRHSYYELLFLHDEWYVISRASSLKRAKRRFIAMVNKQFK